VEAVPCVSGRGTASQPSGNSGNRTLQVAF
jgi:hypothetical protein